MSEPIFPVGEDTDRQETLIVKIYDLCRHAELVSASLLFFAKRYDV